MSLRVVMLGAPGAGKGTQAKRIAMVHGVPQISTGDIFRDHVARQTALGLEVKRYLDAGQLVPDSLVCDVVVDRLKDLDCVEGYVLDGFPRSLPQAQVLRDRLSAESRHLDVVLNLTVHDEELVERLTARRSCPKCGAIYNLKFNPPRRDGFCDNEGDEDVKLVQRPDDREDTIRKRLKVYHRTTEPLLAFYAEADLLRNVNGSGLAPEAIFERIEEILLAVGGAQVS